MPKTVRLQRIKKNGWNQYVLTLPSAIAEALPGIQKGDVFEVAIVSVDPPSIKFTKAK